MVAAALLALLVVRMPARAFDAPAIVGVWDCVSSTTDGEDHEWTLTVKQENGNLAAIVEGGGLGDVQVQDFKAEGTTATFTAKTGSGSYAVKLTVTGASLDGSFDGEQASGTIKGKKRS